MTKPFDPADLVEIVSGLLTRRQSSALPAPAGRSAPE
jgi:DNA-binding response OmpR family regulator